jgi:hypothetical protein
MLVVHALFACNRLFGHNSMAEGTQKCNEPGLPERTQRLKYLQATEEYIPMFSVAHVSGPTLLKTPRTVV